MKRMAVFRLLHEANSFSPDPAGRAQFEQVEWGHGLQAASRHRGANTAIGAVFDFIDRQPDWQVSFLRMASTTPAGPIPAEFFQEIIDELLGDLAAGAPWDAIALSLHGAGALADGRSSELEIVRAIRSRFPAVPITVSLDLHANIDPEFAELVDISVGYKTHPHIDMRACSAKSLRLLQAMLRGDIRPVHVVRKLPLLLPSVNMRTTDGPMRDVVSFAQMRAEQEGALDITVYGGFPYGDCTMVGAGVTVVTDGDRALAERLAEEVAQYLWDRRAGFFQTMPSTAAALAGITGATVFPVAIVDNGDNPGSGGGADTPGQLRSLLAADLPWKTAYCFLHDPDLVQRARAAGQGARLAVALGGRKSAAYGPPVAVEVEVERLLADAAYVCSGPQNNGLPFSHGASAVLRAGNVSIVVTSICVPVSDPEFFRIHGIDFAETRVLAAKAKNHFRAAMRPVFSAIIDVDEPGPAMYDFAGLPYRHAPAAVFAAGTEDPG